MTRRMLSIAVAGALLALPGSGRAQEKTKPEAAKPEAPKAEAGKEGTADRRGPQGVTLQVQLVISRFQGERKVASLPYTLLVTTGGGRARMRMGVDTPVPVTSTSDSGKQTTSIQYRNVGTNIDCAAWDKGEGRYQLSIGVENSSALALEKGPSSGNAGAPLADGNPTGSPLFRRFDANLDPWFRDGQSLQTIASTDPVTGEVVKIDVTMNVVR
jgi:hypothetical protein